MFLFIHYTRQINSYFHFSSGTNELINDLKSTMELFAEGAVKLDDAVSPSKQNKTDKVFDVLNLYINQSKTDLAHEEEFINCLKHVIRENGVSQQRKREKLARLWLVFTFLVLCFMVFMVVLFAMEVHSISNDFMERLENKLKANASALNNSTLSNCTLS